MASPPATPSGVRVIAISPDGIERNITDAVGVLYDLVIESMDGNSDFDAITWTTRRSRRLRVQELDPIIDLARFCGFNAEDAEKYLANAMEREKQRDCPHPQWREEPRREPYASAPGYRYVTRICVECGCERKDALP